MTGEQSMVIVERFGEHGLLIRLNRPEKHNALSTGGLAGVADALDAADADDTVRCAVIAGNDKLFAVGADIGELLSREAVGMLSDPRPAIWRRIRGFTKPLIAAVEGWSLGAGNELMMCCDLVVAGHGAKFGQPETNLGLIPGAGGTAVLPRLVGRARAMRMVLLGDPLSAQEALQAGLITELVDDGLALSAAQVLADRIAARAPVAMRQGKALINAALDVHLGAHLMLERQGFSATFCTADRKEGITAFLEKRPPLWKGT